MSTSTLPDSAGLALWYSAWAAGATSLDEARDAIVGADAEHHVAGLPGEDDVVPLILAFGRLRSAGATGAGIALPVPGDPLGLAGPAGFNTRALDAEESVLFEGADIGLVPYRAGSGVVWTYYEASSRRQIPDPSEADTGLRQAVLAAANTLAELDVARWRPEVADALMGLRRTADLHFPQGMSPRALNLASMSTRCLTIVDLALEDDGPPPRHGRPTSDVMPWRRSTTLQDEGLSPLARSRGSDSLRPSCQTRTTPPRTTHRRLS